MNRYVVFHNYGCEGWKIVDQVATIAEAVTAREEDLANGGGEVLIFETVDILDAYAQAARLTRSPLLIVPPMSLPVPLPLPGKSVPIKGPDFTGLFVSGDPAYDYEAEAARLLAEPARIVAAPVNRPAVYTAKEVTAKGESV